MNIGMLWFDNDSKADLASKIERAASYYQNKYGKRPNLVFVHPSMAPVAAEWNGLPVRSASPRSGSIEIRTTRAVLPNHLWIGIDNPAGLTKTNA